MATRQHVRRGGVCVEIEVPDNHPRGSDGASLIRPNQKGRHNVDFEIRRQRLRAQSLRPVIKTVEIYGEEWHIRGLTLPENNQVSMLCPRDADGMLDTQSQDDYEQVLSVIFAYCLCKGPEDDTPYWGPLTTEAEVRAAIQSVRDQMLSDRDVTVKDSCARLWGECLLHNEEICPELTAQIRGIRKAAEDYSKALAELLEQQKTEDEEAPLGQTPESSTSSVPPPVDGSEQTLSTSTPLMLQTGSSSTLEAPLPTSEVALT